MANQKFVDHVRRAFRQNNLGALAELITEARNNGYHNHLIHAKKALLRLQYPTLSNKRIREMANE